MKKVLFMQCASMTKDCCFSPHHARQCRQSERWHSWDEEEFTNIKRVNELSLQFAPYAYFSASLPARISRNINDHDRSRPSHMARNKREKTIRPEGKTGSFWAATRRKLDRCKKQIGEIFFFFPPSWLIYIWKGEKIAISLGCFWRGLFGIRHGN